MIELSRTKKRWTQEPGARQHEQTTKQEVETKKEAPVDKPITVDPQLVSSSVHNAQQNMAPEPFAIPTSFFQQAERPA